MSEAPWAKIWWTWYTSRSHLGLSGVALALGAPLMLLGRVAAERNSDAHSDARCDGQSDLVWLRDKAGKPISVGQIASIARFPKSDVESAMAELVESETLVVSADGVYGFPNFWKYQETASAARMRKSRRHSERHSDAKCAAHVTTEGRGKRVEVREKRISAEAALGADAPPLLAESATADEPSVPERLQALEARYRSSLCAETRGACALSRRNGKMADTVWLNTLKAMAGYRVEAVEAAMRTFTERYADGQRDERYLIGIARSNDRGAARQAPSRMGVLRPAPAEAFEETPISDYFDDAEGM